VHRQRAVVHQLPVADQVEDGREGLLLHDVEVVLGLDERRAHVVAGAVVEHLAPEEHAPALGLHRLERRLHRLHRVLVDEGPHERAFLERVPDPDLLVDGTRGGRAPRRRRRRAR
jgi:hypothetical protein